MMRLVEIKKLSNGAHRNNNINDELYPIPEGWAVIPEYVETENFPFGDIRVIEMPLTDDEGETRMITTVIEWIPGVVPEPEPMPEPKPTTDEILNTLLGVTE